MDIEIGNENIKVYGMDCGLNNILLDDNITRSSTRMDLLDSGNWGICDNLRANSDSD